MDICEHRAFKTKENIIVISLSPYIFVPRNGCSTALSTTFDHNGFPGLSPWKAIDATYLVPRRNSDPASGGIRTQVVTTKCHKTIDTVYFCWRFTSQSTIFQSCYFQATLFAASSESDTVFQYFRNSWLEERVLQWPGKKTLRVCLFGTYSVAFNIFQLYYPLALSLGMRLVSHTSPMVYHSQKTQMHKI